MAARRAFGNKAFLKASTSTRSVKAGSYHVPKVLSPRQFKKSGAGFRDITKIDNTRITQTANGAARFSVSGGGYRFTSSGRISHRHTIK